MKIYTKTGDKGETSLLTSGRVPKYHIRVDAYGTFDELNSWIGWTIAITENEEIQSILLKLQPLLHILCSDVASHYKKGKPGGRIPRLTDKDVVSLEEAIDSMDLELPELTHFIHPGGSKTGAALNVARTICRRGERILVQLDHEEGMVNPSALRFVNRLSDYLFTLARWTNYRLGSEETAWIQDDPNSDS